MAEPAPETAAEGAAAPQPPHSSNMEAMTAQQVHDATIMLRRPTVVDKLHDAVPVPATAVPRNGLPCWNKIPLGSKLPIIDHPKDAFVFYRDKLGHKLWRPSPVHEFRLDDPYMREVDYPYEAVHDPALRRMFQAPEWRGLLLSRGFILPSEEAVCSLKQFNAYRRYLHSVYRDLLKQEYHKQAVDLADEQMIRRARHCEEKQMEASRQRAEREKKQSDQRSRLEGELRKKQQQLVERHQRYVELLERMEERKEEQRRDAAERARLLDEKVKYRQAVASEIQRAKVIATIQAWNREEAERKERLEKQQQQLQEYKEKEVLEQWQKKIESQVQREERDARLLARQEEAMRLAVELRNKKIEREDLRMQTLLKKIKTERDKQRAKRLRFRPPKRRRPGRRPSRSKANETKRRRAVRGKGDIADDEVRRYTTSLQVYLEQAFSVSMHIVKSGREQGQTNLIGENMWRLFRETGFDPSETRDGVPEAVAHALDGLFDSVMDGIVHRMVMQTLKCVYHKALERCFALLADLPARELARRGWVCNHGPMQHAEQHAELRGKAKAREGRECGKDTEAGEEGEVQGVSPRSSTRKQTRLRANRRSSEDERQKLQMQIDALERRNQQLKRALEQDLSSTTMASEEDRVSETDLDANFEVLARSLQLRMVAIAAQSVSEDTRLTTHHRWKSMKEVELFELVDRLCAMMMNMSPKMFLKSTEFHWAADILARDVMREVRHQVRQNNRKKRRERARQAKEAETISRRAPRTKAQSQGGVRLQGSGISPRPSSEATRSGRHSSGHSSGHSSVERPPSSPRMPIVLEPTLLEPLDDSQVPLLRLHKRSPHQPSIPSLDSLL